ncbi:MAG: hypothetical protein NNA20_00960 [Nitrospira sp.]|nr:hypothetical protein [Nitrospira sp.]MCP9441137.1 hypothetical protein [Nitrospira sp.]
MSSVLKPSWAETWSRVQAGFRHAFATEADTAALSPEDQALLDRIAETVVQRGMAGPTTVFLESLGPMNFLGGQALHFLAPILEVVLDAKVLEHAARLLERRDTIGRLIMLIEAKSLSRTPPPHAPKGVSAQ